MARMKKGAKTSLKDFNYYGPICVGDIVKDLDTQMECEIDCYGRAMDKAGIDHSKGRLSIVRPHGSSNPPIDIFGERSKDVAEDVAEDFQKDQLEGTEGLTEEASPAGGQETDSETSEATQSSTAEENDMTRGKTEPVTLGGFTDQQLADELRTRGYELTATKIIMVPQEIRL